MLGFATVNLQTKLEVSKVVQNVEIGYFEAVTSYSRSSVTSPFNRAHATSYLTLIETVHHLSSTVFEI